MRKVLEVEQRTPEWHRLRMQSIGGSDVSVLFGLNPYRSLDDLFADKRGLVEPEDLMHNPDIRRGVLMEGLATRLTMGELSGKLAPSHYHVDPHHFMHHSPDGIVVDEDGTRTLLEVKVPRPTRIQDILSHGPNNSWLMQVQHGLHCCQCDKACLSVFDSTNAEVHLFHIDRNESVIERLTVACKSFFEDCVKADEPPYGWRPKAGVSEAEIAVDPVTCDREVPDDQFDGPENLVRRYEEICEEVRGCEQTKRELKAKIEAQFVKHSPSAIGVMCDPAFPAKSIRRHDVKGRESINTKLLQLENPDLDWDRYRKLGAGYKVLKVVKTKKGKRI